MKVESLARNESALFCCKLLCFLCSRFCLFLFIQIDQIQILQAHEKRHQLFVKMETFFFFSLYQCGHYFTAKIANDQSGP